MRKTWLLHFVLAALFTGSLPAQDLSYEPSENGSKMFEVGNYYQAKEIYRKLYKENPLNVKYKYRFGVSLLYTYHHDDAIKILEEVSKKVDVEKAVWYHLGRAYHLKADYQKAIKTYQKFIGFSSVNKELVLEAERNIEMCGNAINLSKFSTNVTFENLGRYVNSKGKDYLPIVFPDESQLYFTTRREGTTGRVYDEKEQYTADIYISKFKSSKWSKAQSMGAPNSYGNEQVAGISELGNKLFYYVDNPLSKNNLQMAIKKKNSIRKPTVLDEKEINKKDSRQMAITMSEDGQTLVFSSDRTGGKGGYDLYMCKKLPNNKWGKPFNLGESINTNYDENFPYLLDDGNTLYFASKGHNSIGGYDLFVSRYDPLNQRWNIPKTMGIPINTPDDDMSICFIKNKKYAYVSRHGDDSFGDLDIYRANFKDVAPQYSIVKGFVLDADSNVVTEPLIIDVFDKNGDLYGSYNSKYGKYLMILQPNEYTVSIDLLEKGMASFPLKILGRKSFRKRIKRNIMLPSHCSK